MRQLAFCFGVPPADGHLAVRRRAIVLPLIRVNLSICQLPTPARLEIAGYGGHLKRSRAKGRRSLLWAEFVAFQRRALLMITVVCSCKKSGFGERVSVVLGALEHGGVVGTAFCRRATCSQTRHWLSVGLARMATSSVRRGLVVTNRSERSSRQLSWTNWQGSHGIILALEPCWQPIRCLISQVLVLIVQVAASETHRLSPLTQEGSSSATSACPTSRRALQSWSLVFLDR